MPYPKSAENRGTRVLQSIHTDICGPTKTPKIEEKRYFFTFIGDLIGFTIIYLLSKKRSINKTHNP